MTTFATAFADHTVTFLGAAASDLSALKSVTGLSCKPGAQDGSLVFTLAANTAVKDVLHFVHENAKGNAAPALQLILESHSELTLIESFRATDPDATPMHAFDIVLKNGARLNYSRVQNEGEKTTHAGTTTVTQGRDSQFDAVILSLGSAEAKHDFNFLLTHEGTESRFFGLYIGRGEQRLENNTFVDHQQPNQSSEQVYKGILGGAAKGLFSGKIDVRKEAQKTDARQTNKTLLLSRNARIDTIPQLNIHADDVKCSHGAAVGQLNAEEVFYFETRGIERNVAQRMLVQGFAEDILMHQSNPRVLAYLKNVLSEKLSSLTVET